MTVVARGEVTRLATPGDHVMITGVCICYCNNNYIFWYVIGLFANGKDRI